MAGGVTLRGSLSDMTRRWGLLAVVGVGLRILPPTFTVDVIANLAFGVPVILLPLCLAMTFLLAPHASVFAQSTSDSPRTELPLLRSTVPSNGLLLAITPL